MRNEKSKNHYVPQNVPVQKKPVWIEIVVVILGVAVLVVVLLVEQEGMLSETGHFSKMEGEYQISWLASSNYLKIGQIIKTKLA
jgi:hypothetical protein